MKLHNTARGPAVEVDGKVLLVPDACWDELINRDGLAAFLAGVARKAERPVALEELAASRLAPIGSQEVWAAGVTYLRSKVARMEESQASGGGDFYDKVYAADRPEIFFKATPHRVVGDGGAVRIRADSKWNVPEPELALLVNSRGQIAGYTIGNDMSSRDIEGENPLYLPQAKVYDGCCGLGPCVLVAEQPLPKSTKIGIEIRRDGATAFKGETALSQMKREPQELVSWLVRESSFPTGCYLLTGTGIVPPDSFTLAVRDEIAISIEGIGMLRNVVGA